MFLMSVFEVYADSTFRGRVTEVADNFARRHANYWKRLTVNHFIGDLVQNLIPWMGTLMGSAQFPSYLTICG